MLNNAEVVSYLLATIVEGDQKCTFSYYTDV